MRVEKKSLKPKQPKKIRKKTKSLKRPENKINQKIPERPVHKNEQKKQNN